MPSPQYRYWSVTIPWADWQPTLPAGICWVKGQHEIGEGGDDPDNGYEHWQLTCSTKDKVTYTKMISLWPNSAHVEHTLCAAIDTYVWKEDTAVPGTMFELGTKSLNRNSKADWEKIFKQAKEGQFDQMPKDVLIRNYNSLKRIRVDYMEKIHRPVIQARVYYGVSGSGKTYDARQEAGPDVYVKNPNTKWWDGYRGEENVLIDEFSGRIDITYLLLWLDVYSCTVEIKGYSTPLAATKFWITSNIALEDWYKEDRATPEQIVALRRRVHVTHYDVPFN